jgi:hypothetical protein
VTALNLAAAVRDRCPLSGTPIQLLESDWDI